MKFLEVLEKAEKLKLHFRRKSWDKRAIFQFTGNMILHKDGEHIVINLEDYKADDWELIENEEKETVDVNIVPGEVYGYDNKITIQLVDNVIEVRLITNDLSVCVISSRNER